MKSDSEIKAEIQLIRLVKWDADAVPSKPEEENPGCIKIIEVTEAGEKVVYERSHH